MNCHQILTGASNVGCSALGSVEGVPFTVGLLICLVIDFSKHFQAL